MLKNPSIMIAGWGYSAAAMGGLSDALTCDSDVMAVSTHDLALKGGIERQSSCVRDLSSSNGLSSYAAGLLALIREQGGPVTLIGWSMGGMAAMELACRCPEWVRRLVLVSATPKFCSAEDFSYGIPVGNVRAMMIGLKRDPSKTLAGFYQLAAMPLAASPPLIRNMEKLVFEWVEELTAGLIYLINTDLRNSLDHIRVPVLMLHGREDRVIPWQAADMASRGLPDGRLCLYDRRGHDLPLRDPAALAVEISRFVASTHA